MPTPRNLVNLKGVEKGFGSRTILNEVTLGVAAGKRIGVVGENGGGKSTLLKLIAGIEQPDAGTLTRTGDVGERTLTQGEDLASRFHEPAGVRRVFAVGSSASASTEPRIETGATTRLLEGRRTGSDR